MWPRSEPNKNGNFDPLKWPKRFIIIGFALLAVGFALIIASWLV